MAIRQKKLQKHRATSALQAYPLYTMIVSSVTLHHELTSSTKMKHLSSCSVREENLLCFFWHYYISTDAEQKGNEHHKCCEYFLLWGANDDFSGYNCLEEILFIIHNIGVPYFNKHKHVLQQWQHKECSSVAQIRESAQRHRLRPAE